MLLHSQLLNNYFDFQIFLKYELMTHNYIDCKLKTIILREFCIDENIKNNKTPSKIL